MTTKKHPRSIRLEPDVEKWLINKAKADDRSFNSEINRFIKKIKEIEEATEQKQTA